MSQHDDGNHSENRAEEFMQMFKKGAEFTQDLLKENERLRYQIVRLEDSLKEHTQSLGEDSPEALAEN